MGSDQRNVPVPMVMGWPTDERVREWYAVEFKFKVPRYADEVQDVCDYCGEKIALSPKTAEKRLEGIVAVCPLCAAKQLQLHPQIRITHLNGAPPLDN